MECSEIVKASREYYITIEKQILRDIAGGILNELYLFTDQNEYLLTKVDLSPLKRLKKFAESLGKLTEEQK